MSATASFLLSPPRHSASLFGAIMRDTRGARLSEEDRLNFFPASPLVRLTHVIEGDLRLLPPGEPLSTFRQAPIMARTFVMPPQDRPMASWSPGPTWVVSVGVYPDAWAQIGDHDRLLGMLAAAFPLGSTPQAGWERFCSSWNAIRTDAGEPIEPARLESWVRALLVRAVLGGPGQGLRSVERRVRRWTGYSRKTLEFFAAFESLHRLSARSNVGSLADLALAAGYSDQSHMGRAVRRGTGFSPAKLNYLIANHEAFWCYRLLSGRL